MDEQSNTAEMEAVDTSAGTSAACSSRPTAVIDVVDIDTVSATTDSDDIQTDDTAKARDMGSNKKTAKSKTPTIITFGYTDYEVGGACACGGIII